MKAMKEVLELYSVKIKKVSSEEQVAKYELITKGYMEIMEARLLDEGANVEIKRHEHIVSELIDETNEQRVVKLNDYR